MLATLEVYNPFVTAAPLPIGGEGSAGTDAIQIRNIDGLGPVKAAISSSSSSTARREFKTGSVVGKRNIVLTLGFNPDWGSQSVESLRMMLYAYFMPESDIRLVFGSTHMPTVEISGTVESCEPDVFSKDPQMVISILCFDSDFIDVEPTVLTGTTRGLGTAPYETISYQGNVKTGFQLDLSVPSGIASMGPEFRIAESAPTFNLFRVTNPGLDSTHNLRVTTQEGQKAVQLLNMVDGTIKNVLGNLRVESTWPQLSYGDNVFWIQTATPGLIWIMSYYARYGGL